MFREDTIAAISTAPGEGGIAVIRVSGPEALDIANKIFLPYRGGKVAEFEGYSVHYGAIVDPALEPRTDTLVTEREDDGLLTVFRAPLSYTGENTAELSCHGGRATSSRVLSLAVANGARLAEPGEFTRRAFLNGKLDLAQAEAVADVIRARTESARRIARRQLDGALSRQVEEIRENLIGVLASVEVTIDFSEEVGELDYDSLEDRLEEAHASVSALLATADRGRILREGIRVAIVGRPNTGKSSLLNALVRTERSIVTPIAGTTRDLVEETANVCGVPIVFVDTAGMRETHDIVEGIGVERARQCARQSDLTLLVVDGEAGGVHTDDLAILRQLEDDEAPSTVVVINKSDTLSPDRIRQVSEDAEIALRGISRLPLIVSALTGQGISELEAAIVAAAAGEEAESNLVEAHEAVVVSSARHREALEITERRLNEARATARGGMPGDFVAIDARGALDALSLITGQTVTDEVIHRIFHDFCVGK